MPFLHSFQHSSAKPISCSINLTIATSSSRLYFFSNVGVTPAAGPLSANCYRDKAANQRLQRSEGRIGAPLTRTP